MDKIATASTSIRQSDYLDYDAQRYFPSMMHHGNVASPRTTARVQHEQHLPAPSDVCLNLTSSVQRFL